MNLSLNRRIGQAGLLLVLLAGLAGCGAAPIAQSQSGTTADERPAASPSTTAGQSAATSSSATAAAGLDQDLLRQVDAEIAAAKARGTDVTAAQQLRDSAVALAQQQKDEEASGNLKTAALVLGLLRPAGGGPAVAAADQSQELPAPPAPGRPASTPLLNATFADASALSGWQPVGPRIPTGKPVWDIQNGQLVQRGVDGVDAVEVPAGLVTGDPSWTDVTVQVDALAQDTREVGLIVRQQGESYYRFRVLAAGTGTNSGNLILEKVVDGQATQLAAFDGPEISSNTWHTLAVRATGSTISCLVDGREVGSAEDSTLKSGRVGVSTLAMSGAHFANLQVLGR